MVPPATVSGVQPKMPTKKRKVNCAPMLGERPAATVKITVPMYTVATECLGEGPCEERSQPITDQELR